jgi:hypothetical protein
MKRDVFGRKSIYTIASAAALGVLLAALPSGASFAKGPNGGNAGGVSADHMSTQGLSNTNGPNAPDRDTGLGRAEDRANEEGLEKGKAFDPAPQDPPSVTDKSATHTGKGQDASGSSKTW